MTSAIPGDNLNGGGEAGEKISEFSADTLRIADSVLDSLLRSNYLVPSQWAGLRHRGMQGRELYLLWAVFLSAWRDLASANRSVAADAAMFFTLPDAGNPFSLRFLCDVFELDLNAVQAVARGRIARSVLG